MTLIISTHVLTRGKLPFCFVVLLISKSSSLINIVVLRSRNVDFMRAGKKQAFIVGPTYAWPRYCYAVPLLSTPPENKREVKSMMLKFCAPHARRANSVSDRSSDRSLRHKSAASLPIGFQPSSQP